MKPGSTLFQVVTCNYFCLSCGHEAGMAKGDQGPSAGPSAFIRENETAEKLLSEQENDEGRTITAWNSSDLLRIVRMAGSAGSWHLESENIILL